MIIKSSLPLTLDLKGRPGARWEECIRYKYKLMAEFNRYGAKRRAGEILAADWDNYVDNEHDPRASWYADEIYKLEMLIKAQVENG